MPIRRIKDIHEERRAQHRPVLSVEFFPPKTPEGETALSKKTIPALTRLPLDYCSVTYGAGGSTRDKTLSIVDRIQREHGLTAMAHLTCVGSTREQIGDVLSECRERGIQNILALRGDPPAGQGEFRPTPGGFEYSKDLVAHIRAHYDVSIGVAGFPEGHIACREGREVDWDRLKEKVDAGADFVLTQLFFNNEDYFRFRDYLEGVGLRAPLCPGILPVLSGRQVTRFTEMCGAVVPEAMRETFDRLGDDDAAVAQYGVDYATAQCRKLLDEGAPGLHFYSLNKAASTRRVLRNLDLEGGALSPPTSRSGR